MDVQNLRYQCLQLAMHWKGGSNGRAEVLKDALAYFDFIANGSAVLNEPALQAPRDKADAA